MAVDGVILYGAGEHGKVVADALVTAGTKIIGFIDDRQPKYEFHDVPYLGNYDKGIESYAEYNWHVSIGDNKVRARLSERLEAKLKKPLQTIVHPMASVSGFSQLDNGCFVAAQAVIAADAQLGKGVIVNHGATIDHDNTIGNFVHICPGAHLAGNVVICDNTFIGVGSSLIQGIAIGENVIVGAGSVVISSIDPDRTIAGNPARTINQEDKS